MLIPNPCPKCGSPYYASYIILDPLIPPLYFIQCKKCLYEIEPVETEEEAIKNWNAEMPVSDLRPTHLKKLSKRQVKIMNPWFKISDTCYVDLTQIALVQEANYMDIRITLKNGIQETIRTPKFASATIGRMELAMKELYEPNLPSINDFEKDYEPEEYCEADWAGWEERHNGDSC